ncbi:MAG: indolepyruvate oxidoreductase subunit beta [Candidatus Atabeyarchaeum deiterrae]
MKEKKENEKENFDIIIAGVGGQGNILASRIVADAAIEAGYHVTIGETFGMSQRGGSVASHLRLGRKKMFGPLIPEASADIVIGLEPLESLRYATIFLKPNGVIVTNSHPVMPPDGNYPAQDRIYDFAKKIPSKLYLLDASQIAKDAGDVLSSNIVMVGAAFGAGVIPVKEEQLKNAIKERLPKAVDLNLKAFDLGKKTVKQA